MTGPETPSPVRLSLDAGRIVALVSSVVLVVCGALKWIDGDPGITGYNVPAKFLVDVEVRQEGLSIGALLVVVAIAGAVGALVPKLRLVTIIAGAGTLVIVALHWYRLGEFADLVNEDAFGTGDVSRGDLIGVGVWVGAAAGIALVVGGVLTGRSDRGAVPS